MTIKLQRSRHLQLCPKFGGGPLPLKRVILISVGCRYIGLKKVSELGYSETINFKNITTHGHER